MNISILVGGLFTFGMGFFFGYLTGIDRENSRMRSEGKIK